MAHIKAHQTKEQRDRQLLDEAFDALEAEVPDWMAKAIHWLREPRSRWVRLPLGILCIVASFLWFLPIIGPEFFPLGLLLIAQDVPFLRRPVAKLLLWLVAKWRVLRAKLKRKVPSRSR